MYERRIIRCEVVKKTLPFHRLPVPAYHHNILTLDESRVLFINYEYVYILDLDNEVWTAIDAPSYRGDNAFAGVIEKSNGDKEVMDPSLQ